MSKKITFWPHHAANEQKYDKNIGSNTMLMLIVMMIFRK